MAATRTHLALDIRDYSGMVASRSGADVAKMMRAYERMVRASLPKRVPKPDQRGDSMQLVFSTPGEAVRTAIAIAEAVQRHNTRHPDLKAPVTFGIEAGQSVKQRDAFVGPAPIVANRLASRAEPGQILIGDGAAALLRTAKAAPLRDLGLWRPKGIDPVHVYEVRAPDPGFEGPREPERQLATALHTDIVASTATGAARPGSDGWKAMFERYHAIVREELRRHGGVEVDTAGDGFYVTFATPSRAIDCGIAMRDRLRGELSIEIRTGIHTGECEVIAGKVGGIAVVVAGRVKDRAGGGDVLVSRTVKDLLLGARYAFTARGPATLKGVPEEWEIYAVEPAPA